MISNWTLYYEHTEPNGECKSEELYYEKRESALENYALLAQQMLVAKQEGMIKNYKIVLYQLMGHIEG